MSKKSTVAAYPSDRLRDLWVRSRGVAWSPRDPTGPGVLALLAGGWVRRVDGRCGFELIPDAMLEWTDAARFAMRAWDAAEALAFPA